MYKLCSEFRTTLFSSPTSLLAFVVYRKLTVPMGCSCFRGGTRREDQARPEDAAKATACATPSSAATPAVVAEPPAEAPAQPIRVAALEMLPSPFDSALVDNTQPAASSSGFHAPLRRDLTRGNYDDGTPGRPRSAEEGDPTADAAQQVGNSSVTTERYSPVGTRRAAGLTEGPVWILMYSWIQSLLLLI